MNDHKQMQSGHKTFVSTTEKGESGPNGDADGGGYADEYNEGT